MTKRSLMLFTSASDTSRADLDELARVVAGAPLLALLLVVTVVVVGVVAA